MSIYVLHITFLCSLGRYVRISKSLQYLPFPLLTSWGTNRPPLCLARAKPCELCEKWLQFFKPLVIHIQQNTSTYIGCHMGKLSILRFNSMEKLTNEIETFWCWCYNVSTSRSAQTRKCLELVALLTLGFVALKTMSLHFAPAHQPLWTWLTWLHTITRA